MQKTDKLYSEMISPRGWADEDTEWSGLNRL
jgi:hypothetical protein